MKTQPTTFEAKAHELVRYIDAMVMRFMLAESQTQAEVGDLNKQELKIIKLLGNSGPCKMSEITEYIMLVNSAATAIVDKLADKGFVSRFRVPEDRRVVKVELTDSGWTVYRLEVEKYLNLSRGMLQSLTDEEQDQLLTLFRRISQQSQQSSPSPGS
jgi:DNA-binding MarR family transcriptional regulator